MMKNLFNKITKGCLAIKGKVKQCCSALAGTKFMGPVVKAVRIPFIGYLMLACVLNFILEILSRHSFLKAILFIGKSPLVFLYNAFIIFVTLSLVQFAKKKVFATLFVCIVWIVSAFANFIVLSFRTTPFSAIDLMMVRNVMTMLDKYMTKWQIVISAIGIVLGVLLLVYLYVRLPVTEHKRHPLRASAYVCMCAFLVWTLTKVAVQTHTVSDNFGNLAYAYNDYGFAYCFSNSIIDVGISKPGDYSEEMIHSIVDGLGYDKSEVIFETEEEAWARRQALEDAATEDLGRDSGLPESKQQAETGDGVQTKEGADTESEADVIQSDGRVDIAGNQQDGISGDETVGRKAEELVYYKNEPATKEYPNIIVIQLESVFDTQYMKDFYPSEDPMPTFTRLKKEYSSGLFTVPAVGAGTANTEFEVQTGMSTQFFGAGEYPFKTVMRTVSCGSMAYDLKRFGYATAGFHNNDATFYERHIDYSNLGFDSFSGMEHLYKLDFTPRGWARDSQLDDIMLERLRQTGGRDYITTITVQCHGRYPKVFTKTMTDLTCYFEGQYAEDLEKQAAWQYYVNMCRELDNMLADLLEKLNTLDEPTVVFMYGDHLPSLSLLETDLDGISLYQTEWVMWDNIGLPAEKKDLISYQASAYIFNRLKLSGGLMQRFHNKYMRSPNQEDYLHKLELLEYDTLYGQNYAYDGFNPFPQTNMQMGIREIKVTGFEDHGEQVWIKGTNFNGYSCVVIDGKEVVTRRFNETLMAVSAEDFKKGSELYVIQRGDDSIELSRTETVIINEDLDAK